MPFDEKIIKRFWKYVERIPFHECWEWIGGSYGRYGAFSINHDKTTGAHRFSYELHYGPIPKGFLIRHSCDNGFCVNPKHLSVGTNKDNAEDRNKRMRHSFGEHRPTSKLTEEQVKYIKNSEENAIYLSKKFGVSATAISHIWKNINWKHV